MKAMNYALRTFKNGERKLGLVSIDPLKIDKMDVIQGENSPVNIELNFQNVDLLGLSQTLIKSVTGFQKDFNRKKVEVRGFIPTINFIGGYKISGRILVLPITGVGQSNITLSRTECVVRFLPKSIIKNGKEYMHVERLKLKLATSR